MRACTRTYAHTKDPYGIAVTANHPLQDWLKHYLITVSRDIDIMQDLRNDNKWMGNEDTKSLPDGNLGEQVLFWFLIALAVVAFVDLCFIGACVYCLDLRRIANDEHNQQEVHLLGRTYTAYTLLFVPIPFFLQQDNNANPSSARGGANGSSRSLTENLAGAGAGNDEVFCREHML